MKLIRTTYFLSSFLLLMACEKDQVPSETGYKLSVFADNGSNKTTSAVSLNSGYVNVTEVELEKEDINDSLEVEVDIEGVFQFDLMTGVSTPAFPTASVPAGTYHELEIQMGDDDSILAAHLEADYTDAGNTILIVIDIAEEISFELENEVTGFQIQPNAVQQINVVMGINDILNDLDWISATITNGQILLNEQTNSDLYDDLVDLLNVEIEIE